MEKKKKANLIIIDPQNDFVNPKGSLFVNEADNDMIRISEMIKKIKHSIDNITVTLDTHAIMSIFHSCFWVDIYGSNVSPYTDITLREYEMGLYKPINNLHKDIVMKYLKKEKHIYIWPDHCIYGTWGVDICDVLQKTLDEYEKVSTYPVEHITKGLCPFTEQFSALKAAFPYDDIPSTQLNIMFLNEIRNYKMNIICGEASSHCVLSTIKHIIKYSSDEVIKSLIMVSDGMSCVKGFEKDTEDNMRALYEQGVQFLTTGELEIYLREDKHG